MKFKYKKIFVLALIVFYFIFFKKGNANAQFVQEDCNIKINKQELSTISRRVRNLDNRIQKSKKREKNIFGESAEGGKITGYFKDDVILKIVSEFFGETGKSKAEYYFYKNKPFFIRSAYSEYQQSINERREPIIQSIILEEYYSFNNKLKCWWIKKSDAKSDYVERIESPPKVMERIDQFIQVLNRE